MARELAKVEEERAVMLAGISHDLRTPLARLRLEAEISVADEEARKAMAQDIDQLDAIIDKFMDYARPDDTKTKPVDLGLVIEREAAAFRDKSQIRFSLRCRRASRCMATTWNWAASSPTCSRTPAATAARWKPAWPRSRSATSSPATRSSSPCATTARACRPRSSTS
jgi:signal transduction histidine kinase